MQALPELPLIWPSETLLFSLNLGVNQLFELVADVSKSVFPMNFVVTGTYVGCVVSLFLLPNHCKQKQ